MNPRNAFDKELESLYIDLIKMGSLAEDAIECAIKALQELDKTLAKTVIDGDNQIDEMEKLIESKCLSLILRQQPIAGDLRNITTALKMITDIERIGDHASDIAQLTIKIKGELLYDVFQHIPQMAEKAVKMVHDSITAFVHKNLVEAERIIAADDEVDALFCLVKTDLSDVLKQDKDVHHNSIDFLMIAKYLERIADHAVNICEWIIFSVTGEHKNIQIL